MLLTPTIDYLFDWGFICFENDSELHSSHVTHEDSMKRMENITDSIVNDGGIAEPLSYPLRLDRGEDQGKVSNPFPQLLNSNYQPSLGLHDPNVLLKREANP